MFKNKSPFQDEGPKVVKVWIIQARGLRDADWAFGGKSDPYATCEVIGKPHTLFKTHVVDESLNPVWNYEGMIGDMIEGETLQFIVYDKDIGKNDDVLGIAELKWEDFAYKENGWKGTLTLAKAGDDILATLLVHVFIGDMKTQVALYTSKADKKRQRNQQKAVVTRRQFRDFLAVEQARSKSCATLPFTLLIWLVFAAVAWLHGDVQPTYRLTQALSTVLEEAQVTYTLPFSTVTQDVTLGTVHNTEQMFNWIGNGLVPALHGHGERPGFMRGFNQVIGKVRLKQTRHEIAPCEVNDGLKGYFSQGCRNNVISAAQYGPEPENYTVVVRDEATNLPRRDTIPVPDPAFLPSAPAAAASSGDAPQATFVAWVDPLHPEWSTNRVFGLMRDGWCDDLTSSVDINAAIFNPEVNTLVQLHVRFTFESSGLIRSESDVRPLPANLYPNTMRIVIDLIWVLLLLGGFVSSMQEFSERRGKDTAWYLWLATDFVSTFFGIGIVIFFAIFSLGTGAVGKGLSDMTALGPTPTPFSLSATPQTKHDWYKTSGAYEQAVTEVIEGLSTLVTVRIYHRLSMFWYTIVIMSRFFRGFMGQPRLAAIGRTIASASGDLLHAGIILFIVFENFAMGGMVLFGLELKHWSSISGANRTTLALLFGKGDFAAMSEIAPISAIIWLVTFVICIVFLLANILVAIVVDHFKDQKRVAGQAEQGLLEQTFTFLGDVGWRCSYESRVVMRYLKRKLPIKFSKFLPMIPNEEKRVKRIPYASLIESMDTGYHVEPRAGSKQSVGVTPVTPVRGPDVKRIPMWAPITRQDLMDGGVDSKTANRLLAKSYWITHQRVPNDFPADVLYHQFESEMQNSYEKLEGTGVELHTWLQERLRDCGNLEPRQKKLIDVSNNLATKDGDRPLATEDQPLGYMPGSPELEDPAEGTPMLPGGPS